MCTVTVLLHEFRTEERRQMNDDATLKTVQLFACSILRQFFISELVFLLLSTLIYVSENDWRFLYWGATLYPLTASLITKQWPISRERMKQYNQKGTVPPCFKPYAEAINNRDSSCIEALELFVVGNDSVFPQRTVDGLIPLHDPL